MVIPTALVPDDLIIIISRSVSEEGAALTLLLCGQEIHVCRRPRETTSQDDTSSSGSILGWNDRPISHHFDNCQQPTLL